MSKIVIDGREILGTTGRYIRKLLEYLQQQETDHEFYVLLHKKGFDKTILKAPNVHKILVSPRKFTLAEQLMLPHKIHKLHPDLVHFTLTNQPAWYRGTTITTIHDLTPLNFLNDSSPAHRARQQVFRWLTRRVAYRSRHLLVPSKYVKNAVVDFARIPPKKVTVTYEAADTIAGAAQPINTIEGKRFIFFTGRAQAHKNLLRLVQAFALIHADHPDLYLVLAGRKSNRYAEIEAFAAGSDARNRILFPGHVSEAELKWLYTNAVAYVLPSLSEGFGLPGLEAMMHGCPLLSSNATCLPEIYGHAALYFDPLNTEELAQKMNDIVRQPALRRELIAKGYEHVSKFSWQRMTEQTLRAYDDALRNPR